MSSWTPSLEASGSTLSSDTEMKHQSYSLLSVMCTIANLYAPIHNVCISLYVSQWSFMTPSGKRATKRVLSQPASQPCGLAVGSEPLVKVINLCNGPIRLQFRRLMTARCVTARVGPAAGWVVAFMYGDERKTSRLSLAVSALTRKMTSFF